MWQPPGSDARPGTYFNGERAAHLNYAEIGVAVPQNHVTGEIELPAKAPGNPKTDLVVQEAAYIESEKEFIGRLNAELSQLAALGAVVVDMTDVKTNDSANHGKFAELAQLGPELSTVLAGAAVMAHPRQKPRSQLLAVR